MAIDEKIKELIKNDKKQEVTKLGVKVINPLLKLLKENDESLRLRAIETIGMIGKENKVPEVINPLINMLGNEHKWTRLYSSTALGKLGEYATKPLKEALRNKNLHVRALAADALGEIDRNLKSAKSLPALVKLLDDPEEEVKYRTIYAIGDIFYWSETLKKVKDQIPEVISSLIKKLDDPSEKVRIGATSILKSIYSDALLFLKIDYSHIVDSLSKLLKDKEAKVRANVAGSLAFLHIKEETPSIKNCLISLFNNLKDEDPEVRAKTLEAIGNFAKIIQIDEMDPVIKALEDPHAKARSYAAFALKEMSKRTDVSKAINLLVKASKDPDPYVSTTSLAALEEIRKHLPKKRMEMSYKNKNDQIILGSLFTIESFLCGKGSFNHKPALNQIDKSIDFNKFETLIKK